MAAEGWSRRFDDPIPLPGGRALATLRDAGEYIAGLPASEQHQEHWRTAIETLLVGRRALWHRHAGRDRDAPCAGQWQAGIIASAAPEAVEKYRNVPQSPSRPSHVL